MADPAAPDSLALVAVTRENVRAVCELRLHEGQSHLVGPAAFTVAEAHYEPGALLRCITDAGSAIGVLLVQMDGPEPYLVRFMIDRDDQGRGCGRVAVAMLLEELRDRGQRALTTSVVPVHEGSLGFWRRCGFAATGEQHGDEPLLRYALTDAGP